LFTLSLFSDRCQTCFCCLLVELPDRHPCETSPAAESTAVVLKERMDLI